MSMGTPHRAVPTLTEVLDEASIRPAEIEAVAPVEPASETAVAVQEEAASPPAFEPFAEPAPLPAPVDDFELDLGLETAPEAPPAPAASAPAAPAVADIGASFYDALELGLRQRASLALDVALDGWLQQTLRERLEQAAARQTESLLQELRELLAPQLETLVQQTLSELLRQERERLSSR